jgi:carboxyl-terminal processing protease
MPALPAWNERTDLMFRPGLARLLAGALAALLLTSGARAVEEQPSQPRVVLVGINDYKDDQIKDRKHAEEDARALYDLFTNKTYLGADPKNVKLFLGKPDKKRNSQPATRKNILDALDWLAAESKRDDLTILVFIGQGGPLGVKSDRRTYFTADSTFKGRNKNSISAAEIGEHLKKLKSRKFLTFLDINFRGFKAKDVPETTLGRSPYREFLGDDGTDEHNFLPGRVAYLATNGLTGSLDLADHGIFTSVLLSGLKGEADKEGYEPDGLVTVSELTDYLMKNLPKLADDKGKTDEEKGQIPFVLGDRKGSTPITTNPAVVASVKQRLEKFDKLVEAGKVPEKLADEGRRLLRQMPSLDAQKDLRKAYQQLADGKLTAKKFEARRNEIFESLKLDRAIAEKFADKVLEGSQMLLDRFVRKVAQGDLVNSAVRGLYRRIHEKIPEDITDRLAGIKKLNEGELRKLLVDARMQLGKREDLAGQKDINIALQRMFGQLGDPYSTFIDPDTLEQFRKGTEGKFTGIGVQIRKDRASDMLLVVTPLKGSPAYKAGIKAGDLITTVTREVDKTGKPLDKPDVISTKGLSISEAVSKIVGKQGTKVKITVQRPGEKKPIVFEVARDTIELETVMGYKRKADDEWDFMADSTDKIGYIRLTQFTEHTFRDTVKAVKELKKQGLKGLVLDMRFNPGGLLYSAKNISDLFIDDGLIVSVRPRKGREIKELGESLESELSFPMVVLVNGDSASGSEIVAACLQDHCRAVVMGERSYGKGSVQNVENFAGGQVKMTTASFWRPNGKNLNKASTKGRDEDVWGVTPNKGYLLKLSFKESEDLKEHLDGTELIVPKGSTRKKANPEFKDRQMEMALKYLRGQIKLADSASGKTID